MLSRYCLLIFNLYYITSLSVTTFFFCIYCFFTKFIIFFLILYFFFIYFFFFFQAEDGIRDHCVTGVQTCALPISCASTYHPDGNVVIPQSLMKGDDHCHFQWIMPPNARTLDLGEPSELGRKLARDRKSVV